MKRTNTIAIDCGNSFIKAALIDTESGTILKQQSTPTSLTDSERAAGITQIGKTADVVKSTIAAFLAVSETEQTVVSLSNEMHGFVLTDLDFKPVTDYISWKDETCLSDEKTDWLGEFRSRVAELDIFDTGMPLRGGGAANLNLFYYVNHTLANYDRGKLRFLTLGDYLFAIITGKEPIAHSTNAAATGLYSVTRQEYNQSVIASLGCSDIVFPQVDDCATASVVLGDKVIIVLPPVGDQQAALVGVGLCEAQTDIGWVLSVNMGTGGQVSVLSKTAEFGINYQIRPFFDAPFIKTVPHIPSGRALNVFFGLVRECCNTYAPVDDDMVWEFIFREASECKNPNIGVDLSFFTNAVTKHTNGGLYEICENGLSVGNIFASAFRQMADNVRLCAQRITDIGKIDSVTFSGGIVARNVLLRRLILERLGVAKHTIAENETLIGLNILAQRAISNLSIPPVREH